MVTGIPMIHIGKLRPRILFTLEMKNFRTETLHRGPKKRSIDHNRTRNT